ncbi:hypothetical protein BHM03_00023159 [Ensete ventricosum]|nr:hypothetical protein BHM03_00023159 [Ensete ventricosum]
MVERTRRADQPAAPLTVGGWQHGRADATGRPACSTPDNRRLAAWQNECDRLTSLQHPSQQAAGGMSGTIAMMWPAYNVLAYAGINTPRLPLEGRTDLLRRNRPEVGIVLSRRQTTEATLRTRVTSPDVELSVLTPDRYWRLLTDPGLTPPIHTLSQMIPAEAFFGLAH